MCVLNGILNLRERSLKVDSSVNLLAEKTTPEATRTLDISNDV